MTRNRTQHLLNAFHKALLTRRTYHANPNPGTLGGYRDRRKALLIQAKKARATAGRPDLRGCVRQAAEARLATAEGRARDRWSGHYNGACGW